MDKSPCLIKLHARERERATRQIPYMTRCNVIVFQNVIRTMKRKRKRRQKIKNARLGHYFILFFLK